MEPKSHRPLEETSYVWAFPDGEQQAESSLLADRSFQVSSIKFSIKAERDLVLLTAEALRELHSKVTHTMASDPWDPRLGRAERGSGKKIALESMKWEGGQRHWDAMDLITKCSLQETLRSETHKWNKSSWLTRRFSYTPWSLFQLWTCSTEALGVCSTGFFLLSLLLQPPL